jgi:hypothetical protein
MPVPPRNPYTSDVKQARKVKILLGGADGSDATEEVTFLQLVRIHRSNGGRKLDYAEFVYNLAETNERIVDHLVHEEIARLVEVWLLDERGDPTTLLFWGELTLERIQLNREEHLTMQACVHPWHFGDICEGVKVWNRLGVSEDNEEVGAGQLINVDPVFQPEIDGKIENNMSTQIDSEHLYKLWIDPESVRSSAAREYQQAHAEEWTLIDVIDSLQWLLNTDEEFIENSDVNSDDPIFEEMPTVRNLHLRRGAYLPQYLDDILLPYGYGWCLQLGTRDSEEGEEGEHENRSLKKLRIYKQGEGEEKKLYLQKPGETLDLAKTNTEQTQLDIDIADLANVIVGQGSFEQRQVTLPLFRGWPESQDALDVIDLLKSEPTAPRNAWRLFVGNEDGSYNGTRTGVHPIGEIDVPDLNFDFSQWVPRRQKIQPCLDRGLDRGVRMRPVLEWSGDDGETWNRVPDEWGYSILDDQIGVYFSGEEIPEEIRFAADRATLRITGTLTGPHRLQASATRQSTSPNGRDVKLFLDLSDRFHDRFVITAGPYASTIGQNQQADERDDEDALREFLEAARDIEDAAGMTGSFVLHGIHLDYEIGDLLTRIDGRDIFLNRKSVGADEKRYLQITGIIYDWQEQQTTIEVESEYIGELDRKLNRAALT